MKRSLTYLILVCLFLPAAALSAVSYKVRGYVKDANGEAVGFCNVIFTSSSDSLTVLGDITNAEGYFDMPVPAGEYHLTVTMMGYEPYRKTVVLSENTDLGTIVLTESAVKLDAVVVTTDMVRRRADGYMFLPAGSALTSGRNSLELLAYAPGVWVDKDRGITINGKSGTRVMVNDRLLNLSAEELNAYLESIDAEQIRSVEVIPDPGAQYDADAQGGILKITLKRSLNGGLSGSAALTATAHDDLFPGRVRPSLSLEYRKDRLSLYTNLYYQDGKHLETDHEYTQYESDDDRRIETLLNFDSHNKNISARVGSVYDLTDRQSVGVDFDYFRSDGNEYGTSTGTIRSNVYQADAASYYTNLNTSDRYSVSFNYRLKTDQKGSNLIVMADYMYNKSDLFENNRSSEIPLSLPEFGSNRNVDRSSETDYYTLRVDYKHYIDQKFQLETGAKYGYTDMNTQIGYEDLIDEAWVPNADLNDHYLYREGVLAGYVNGTGNLGRWNLSAGLRVENTDLRPYSYVNPEETKKQNYTDLFPTVRAVYHLNMEKGHLINASYTRRISRPSFSQLNPFRIQLNNYTYIVGNPDMQPSYMDSYTLTGVLANKYSLTLGYNDTEGAVAQVVIPDPDDPAILLYQRRNVDRVQNLFVSLSLPVQMRNWWKISVDAFAIRSYNRLEGYDIDRNMFQGRLNNLFTFPQNWSAEANYTYISGFVQGNMELGSWSSLNLAVKKTFFDNRLSASFSVDNVLDGGGWIHSATITQPGNFSKRLELRNSQNPTRRYGLSLRWNFKTGKESKKVQKVVYGNEEERER